MGHIHTSQDVGCIRVGIYNHSPLFLGLSPVQSQRRQPQCHCAAEAQTVYVLPGQSCRKGALLTRTYVMEYNRPFQVTRVQPAYTATSLEKING